MKGIFYALMVISLLLSGCSSNVNKGADNKTTQNSEAKEKETKEEKNTNKEEKENAKTEKKKGDSIKESSAKNKNSAESSNKKSSSNKSSNKQTSISTNPIVQAALKYRGSSMACDQLVTMALVDTGVITGTPEEIFHDGAYYNIGVYQFPSLGTFISASSAQPGDLIYYDDGGYGSAHIAVYAGNGEAVHGGWLGNQVVLGYVDTGGSTPKYMRFPTQSWDTISNTLFPSSNEDIIEYPLDDSSLPQIPSNSGEESVSTTYTGIYSSGDISVTVTSSTPIDENFMWEQIFAYSSGEITYEQMVANVQEKGYTIM